MLPNDDTKPITPKHIAITGATGLIGTALSQAFETDGHIIHRVSRSQPTKDTDIFWQPMGNEIDADALEGVDVVIHLAGENLFGRWSDKKKTAIMESRRQGTTLLAKSLAALKNPPEVFVSTSAVGFYGNTHAQIVDEDSPAGDTFLAEVCREWEAASEPAREAGIRTVNPRLGVVLTNKGGALKMMLTPFKFGLGGRISDGSQYMSWITLDDVVRALQYIVATPELNGPVNVTSPEPVSNKEFTKVLGGVLNRPTPFPLPGPLIKLGAGQMGEEMLLHGQRAVPTALEGAGFSFAYPQLEAALRHALD